ncbi:McrC family protein [Streptomyces sp. NPDC050485]|uniref:McrC family protein n=1 Tax=Streptomyces sp. NPDC050485 TaxID=3365617 RepID=UPI003791A5BE
MTDAPLQRLTAPDRRIIPCREYGPIQVNSRDVLGPDGRLAIAPGVLGRYVRADFKDSELRLAAKGVTGLIPLTDRITIQVQPRFPLQNLTHMVSVCGYSPTALSALREYKATDRWSEWLLDVMADGLLAAMNTISLNGLFRTYHSRTETSSHPHGRINTTATILRYAAQGINHRAQYSWFERTIDNPLNRCLKSAIAFLCAHYVHAPRNRAIRERIARLSEAMRVLHDVTLESRPLSLNDPQVRGARPLPESRSYYRPALELALAILTGQGISLDAHGGDVSLPSLLVKTEDLFEQFVRLSLQRALSGHSKLAVLDGNQAPGRLSLYETVPETTRAKLPEYEVPTLRGSAPKAEPDVVFRMEDETHPLVADVKYTNVRDYADRSEVEQIVLYGLRYRSPVVMTIHPKRADSKKGLHVVGRIGSVMVAQYRIDLGTDDLEAEMAEMAGRISELIAAQSSSGSPAGEALPSPA